MVKKFIDIYRQRKHPRLREGRCNQNAEGWSAERQIGQPF